MKRLLFLLPVLLLVSCLSPHGVMTGDNDTRTNAEKNGFACDCATFETKNKSDYAQTATVGSELITVDPAKRFLFFRVATRVKIPLKPGMHHVYDGHGDHLEAEFIPCLLYRHTFSKKAPDPSLTALDLMFSN